MINWKICGKQIFILLLVSSFLFTSFDLIKSWKTETHQRYLLYYTVEDSLQTGEYSKIIDEGVFRVQRFFNSRFKKDFAVYIFPDRSSLDSQWQKNWNEPSFKSECWMVASGVATRLDMIAPKKWDKLSCEHKYEETENTKNLITHELVHVYHGQFNPSPDFSKVNNLDWFVEGLAVYASGQCDSARLNEVRKAIVNNEIPEKLDKFWTGKLRYGLSGSVVMYLDKKFGREKIKELLSITQSSELFQSIWIKEEDFITSWKNYMLKSSEVKSK